MTLSLFGFLYLLNVFMRLILAFYALLFHLSAFAFTFAPTSPFEQAQFLPAEQAFQLSVSAPQEGRFNATWEIADGYYLYQQRFSFSGPQANHLYFAPFPQGDAHEDEYYGKVTIYRQQLRLPIYYDIQLPAGTKVQANLHFQGCADKGLCYPPQSMPIQFTVPDANHQAADKKPTPFSSTQASTKPTPFSSTQASTKPTPETATATKTKVTPSSAQQVIHALQQEAWFSSLWLMFGLGLLLSFTPCVLPMVPIVSAIVLGKPTQPATEKRLTASLRGLYLSSAYVLGMALTYAAIGALVGLLGLSFNLQAQLQNPMLIGASILLFVLLALAMFGVYELSLPTRWQNSLQESPLFSLASKRAGLTAFMAGILATLIVSPCVSAPLAGALLFISSQGDAAYGALVLFIMALGMGTPLLLVGVFGASILPKRGAWLDEVKVIMGFGLLAVAIWLSRAWLPNGGELFLWALFALAMSGYFIHRGLKVASHPIRWLLAMVFFLLGSIQLVGGLSGATSPLQPFSGFTSHAIIQDNSDRILSASHDSLFDAQIGSLAELDQLVKDADPRPMVLDLYADWCISCRTVEGILASNAAQQPLAQLRLIRVDVTDNTKDNQALMQKFQLYGPPSLIFLDNQGASLPELALIGEPSRQELIERLAALAALGEE
ncbi:protein-disulfide reductase DsbD [Marinomonas sp. THO17]|uniref:protein-disulfide reductase DsbD n=1 Tax=Marinomonas sp. THO17 TaxID=3149048 RepID=UPI00336BBC51